MSSNFRKWTLNYTKQKGKKKFERHSRCCIRDTIDYYLDA